MVVVETYSVPQKLGCCSQPHGGRVCQAGGVEPRGSGSGAHVPSFCPALLLNLSARVAWSCRPSPGPSAPCLSAVCQAQIQTQILCVSSWTRPGWAAFSGSPSIQYRPPVVLIAIFPKSNIRQRPSWVRRTTLFSSLGQALLFSLGLSFLLCTMGTQMVSEHTSDSETLIFLSREDRCHYNHGSPLWIALGVLAAHS